FDVVEQHALMTFRIHLKVRLAQVTFRVDHKTGAVPVHRSLVLTLAHTRGLQELVIRIREQIDREAKLVAEIFVRLNIVFTHTDDRDVCVVKVLLGCRKRLALNRAAGRVVFWIDVNNEPLAFEVVERDCLAILVLQIEIYETFSFLQSHDCPPVSMLSQTDSICTSCWSCDRSFRCRPSLAVPRQYLKKTR